MPAPSSWQSRSSCASPARYPIPISAPQPGPSNSRDAASKPIPPLPNTFMSNPTTVNHSRHGCGLARKPSGSSGWHCCPTEEALSGYCGADAWSLHGACAPTMSSRRSPQRRSPSPAPQHSRSSRPSEDAVPRRLLPPATSSSRQENNQIPTIGRGFRRVWNEAAYCSFSVRCIGFAQVDS